MRLHNWERYYLDSEGVYYTRAGYGDSIDAVYLARNDAQFQNFLNAYKELGKEEARDDLRKQFHEIRTSSCT